MPDNPARRESDTTMIAMQYSFRLPADYDMAIIRRRIADKGHLLDNIPGLAFKAYLYASHEDIALPGNENLYAPFYLWRDGEGMNTFLAGAGFAALSIDFGRPPVRTWMPWQVELTADLRGSACATCELAAIPAHAPLDALRDGEAAAARGDVASGALALAAVTAYDPDRWKLMRFRLWPLLRPDLAHEGRRLYRVGHVAQPGASR